MGGHHKNSNREDATTYWQGCNYTEKIKMHDRILTQCLGSVMMNRSQDGCTSPLLAILEISSKKDACFPSLRSTQIQWTGRKTEELITNKFYKAGYAFLALHHLPDRLELLPIVQSLLLHSILISRFSQ